MAEKSSSAYELRRRVIDVLRADGDLNEMLFRLIPQVEAEDVRVWASSVELPEDKPQVRSALPRLLVSAIEEEDGFEQPDIATNNSPVMILTHCIAPHDQEFLAEAMDARVKFILLSTVMTNVRIISANLVPTGSPTKRREAQFNDAWTVTRQYRSANVGVLV